MLLLLAACRPDPVITTDSTPPDSTPPDSTDSATDSAVPTGPGSYSDPLVRGEVLPLGVNGPEQTSNGGLWSFDLSDPDHPVLLGRTTTWHIQRLCFDGTDPWGITRSAQVMRLSIAEDVPMITGSWNQGGEGAGIDCDTEHVAWATGTGGAAVATITEQGPQSVRPIGGEVRDVLLEGDRLWALGYDTLTAWQIGDSGLAEIGSMSLPGTCLDLAAGESWLAVACGSGGVVLVDRGEGEPTLLGQWEGHASARAVDVAGDRIFVAAWTDLLLLDATDPTDPWLRATEPAGSAVMAVTAGESGRAYVADWSQPFVVTAADVDAPEVRASPEDATAGSSVRLINDGPAPLWLDTPSAGTLDPPGPLASGAYTTWQIPDGQTEPLSVATDDPDEAVFSLALQSATLQVGQAAPDFIESDLSGTVWELSALQGEVVFLGLFQDG